MTAGDLTPARRLPVVDGKPTFPSEPGEYCGPVTGYSGSLAAVFFLLPNARDADAPPGQRAVHHVTSPPHIFRECADGSLEIRASIGAMPWWHGYLDEGNVWREV
jgi:hypothetical protein